MQGILLKYIKVRRRRPHAMTRKPIPDYFPSPSGLTTGSSGAPRLRRSPRLPDIRRPRGRMSLQRSRGLQGRWSRGAADNRLIRRRALVGGRPDGRAHGPSVAGESKDVVHIVNLNVLGFGPECPLGQRRRVVVVVRRASRERVAGALAGGAADGAAGEGGVRVREGVVAGRRRRLFVRGFARVGDRCRDDGGASVARVAARAAVLEVVEAVLEHVGGEFGFGGGAEGGDVFRGGVAAVQVEGRVDAAGTAGGGHEAAWVDVAV